jgi:hypothetical protein
LIIDHAKIYNEDNDATMIDQFGDDSPNSSITKRPSIVPVLSFNTNPIPQPSPLGTIHKTNMQSIGPSGPSQRNPSPSPHGSIGPQGPQFQRLSQSITSSPNPNGNPKGRPIAPKPNSNSPHTVKETKDIKRNKAQLLKRT